MIKIIGNLKEFILIVKEFWFVCLYLSGKIFMKVCQRANETERGTRKHEYAKSLFALLILFHKFRKIAVFSRPPPLFCLHFVQQESCISMYVYIQFPRQANKRGNFTTEIYAYISNSQALTSLSLLIDLQLVFLPCCPVQRRELEVMRIPYNCILQVVFCLALKLRKLAPAPPDRVLERE